MFCKQSCVLPLVLTSTALHTYPLQAVGASGAAALRPKLHKAAGRGVDSVRTAVLMSAEQSKHTLCVALLREVGRQHVLPLLALQQQQLIPLHTRTACRPRSTCLQHLPARLQCLVCKCCTPYCNSGAVHQLVGTGTSVQFEPSQQRTLSFAPTWVCSDSAEQGSAHQMGSRQRSLDLGSCQRMCSHTGTPYLMKLGGRLKCASWSTATNSTLQDSLVQSCRSSVTAVMSTDRTNGTTAQHHVRPHKSLWKSAQAALLVPSAHHTPLPSCTTVCVHGPVSPISVAGLLTVATAGTVTVPCRWHKCLATACLWQWMVKKSRKSSNKSSSSRCRLTLSGCC